MLKEDIKIIKVLEKVFNFKLSNEQRQIIKYNHKTPILVNSCAGAGKTTLILFDIFYHILTGRCYPESILDVTFSKKAQLDMVQKYVNAKNKLQKFGYTVPSGNSPYFCTFHALFFRLLRHFKQYKNVSVITSYKRFKFALIKGMKHKKLKNMSRDDDLQSIFKIYHKLVSFDYSYDGLYFNKRGKKAYHVDTNSVGQSVGNFINYTSVIKQYHRIKKAKHVIDFDDMVILLLEKLHDKNSKEQIKRIMDRFQLCYIDEFQDINNIQWKIMNIILDKKCFKHLSVIGDDDQSIYSFRGSNPSIIINFTKNVPDAKLFHLSTNYRTNPKVLNSVKPLISRNKYRIKKRLNAYKKHNKTGGLFQINGSKYYDSGQALLEAAWQEYCNPNVKGTDIAILCRYNAYKSIATDFFANRKIYVKTTSLLQQNIVYRVFYNLINAICNNKIKPIFKYARSLGFSQYYNHIKSLKSAFPQIMKSNNLKLAMKAMLKTAKARHLQDTETSKKDKDVFNAIKIMNDGKTSGAVAFSEVKLLTHTYFHYMYHHKFINPIFYNTVIAYLKKELAKYRTANDWLIHEKLKCQRLSHVMKNYAHQNNINILTIHQSKGLQFKYVFMYGLVNLQVHDKDKALDKYFAPHQSRHKFYLTLLKLNNKQLENIDNVSDMDIDKGDTVVSYFDLQRELRLMSKKIKKSHVRRKKKLSAKKQLKNSIISNNQDLFEKLKKNFHLNDKKYLGNFFDDFNSAYNMVLTTCNMVEEERRLVYVACTRSTESTIFDFGNNSSPLLSELDVDRHNKYIMNANEKLIPIVNDKESKRRIIKRHIAKLQGKLKKLE